MSERHVSRLVASMLLYQARDDLRKKRQSYKALRLSQVSGDVFFTYRFPSLFVVAFRRFLKETDPLRSLQLNLALPTKCSSPIFPTCPLSRS